jgi:putative transposase
LSLFVTDGHDGLLAAIADLFPTTLRQRCLVHKQRNVMSAIPKREQQEVITELKGIWQQEKKEDAFLNLMAFQAKYQKRYPEAVRSLIEDEEHLLTFYAFPPVMHRYIRSTNAIESLFSNVRQRTDDRRFHDGNELSCHCLGRDAGHSFAQNPGWLRAEADR